MKTSDKSRRPRSNKAPGRQPDGRGKRKSAQNEPPREKNEAAESSTETLVPERIAKLLARAGVASRREAERMIMAGRIRLNGTVLESPAVNVTLADRIEVDGEPIRGVERTRLWLYHKPSGLVTTNRDPEGRPTVFEKLPSNLPRVLSVGRLDINTEGLLLLTNDGGLARVLELPSTGWLRRYRVRAHGKIEQSALDRLKDGIAVDGVLYGAIDATLDRTQGANVWITMSFREGKNREIKNVLGALGLEVNRLIRISYGPFQLADLKEGAVQEVRGRTLREQLGPRLIEQAGADFEAPLFNETSDSSESSKDASPNRQSDKRVVRNRDEKPERQAPGDKRQRALDRLDTKTPEDKRKRFERRSRASNVWMAPGARPMSKTRSDEDREAGANKSGRKPSASRPKRKSDSTGKGGKPGRGPTGRADRRR